MNLIESIGTAARHVGQEADGFKRGGGSESDTALRVPLAELMDLSMQLINEESKKFFICKGCGLLSTRGFFEQHGRCQKCNTPWSKTRNDPDGAWLTCQDSECRAQLWVPGGIQAEGHDCPRCGDTFA